MESINYARDEKLITTITIPSSLAHRDDVVVPFRSTKTFQPNETVFFEGDPAEFVFEVMEGALKRCKFLVDGRRQITGFVYSGYFAGISPGDRYSYSAEAVTQVELAVYPRGEFERLVKKSPEFSALLLSLTTHELDMAQEQLVVIGRKTALEKVASFLLMMVDRTTLVEGSADRIDFALARSDIADYLGLTVETVCRVFSKLKYLGIISMPEPQQIIILDRDTLLRLSTAGRRKKG